MQTSTPVWDDVSVIPLADNFVRPALAHAKDASWRWHAAGKKRLESDALRPWHAICTGGSCLGVAVHE